VCTALCQLKPNYAATNRTAPDFELPSASGPAKSVRLSDYRGKVVVLNFWTKNCRPCLEEMPSFAELAASLSSNRDVAFVTVSTDETADDVRGTLRSVLGGDPPFATGVDPEAAVVRDKYGTHLYPETWLIDPRGVIRARFDGAREWTSPIVRDLITSLREPLSCSVSFENGRAFGDDAATCDDIGG
jgi:peroxiredoxin